jgi:5-methyltetrahydropteroyltriglutamate--homocysteine methyltransferase
MRARVGGQMSDERFRAVEDAALRDSIARMEETGSPVITDGEQTKPSFATYPLTGLRNLAANGVTIPFADGHARQLPRLTRGPFRYGVHAETYLKTAQRYAHRPVKQAVISSSALSLLYPPEGLSNYSRDAFIDDLTKEAERDNKGLPERRRFLCAGRLHRRPPCAQTGSFRRAPEHVH